MAKEIKKFLFFVAMMSLLGLLYVNFPGPVGLFLFAVAGWHIGGWCWDVSSKIWPTDS